MFGLCLVCFCLFFVCFWSLFWFWFFFGIFFFNSLIAGNSLNRTSTLADFVKGGGSNKSPGTIPVHIVNFQMVGTQRP